jgi:cobalt-zinc-cadmium efflux system outer membrane protein
MRRNFMRRASFTALLLLGATFTLGGCAITRDRGSGEVDSLLEGRGVATVNWPGDADSAAGDARLIAEKTRQPIDVRAAVEIAFLRSPAVREIYADLGISQAEVVDAMALPELRLGYSRLRPEDGGSQITRSVALSLTDLLFLPARIRSARVSSEAARHRLASRLLEHQVEVESAWYEYVAALQAARMRDAAARAAEASAEYARRLHAAGNIPPRALALEAAEASEARIAAARARTEASEARTTFANLVGLASREAWQVPEGLPAIPPHAPAEDSLIEAADSRLDISAAKREAQALESVWRVARWWRWFGDVEVGYERETETDGARLRGPSFSLGIPFDWNRSGVLRTRAELEASNARLSQLRLEARNDISAALDRLSTAREIAETYRTTLVPQREAVTARTLEELNYMVSDAFEALQAKRTQYESYGEYIEAVRDYWLACIQLRLATGGAFAPETSAPDSPAIELDTPAARQDPGHGDHK